MKNILVSIVATSILVGGGSFYGGMKYQESRIGGARGGIQNLGNPSSEERGARRQQFQGIGARNGRAGNSMGNIFSGEIISKDDTSITMKLLDGGSKLIFYSDTTVVSKSVDGTKNDLEIGKTVLINGKTNQDGSVTAQSIQLRNIGNKNQGVEKK